MEAQVLMLWVGIIVLAIIPTIFWMIRYTRQGNAATAAWMDEVARGKFADARRILFKYGTEGRVNMTDENFKKLYQINTRLMKMKGNYKETGIILLDMIRKAGKTSSLADNNGDSTVQKEYMEVFEKTVDGIGFIALEYFTLTRWAMRFGRVFDKSLNNKNFVWFIGNRNRIKEQLELQKEHDEMKKHLKNLKVC